jgi:hypothetical protein
MGEVAAHLRMHLADDQVAALHLARGRHPERVRIRVAVAGPEKQRWLLAAVGDHGLHHAGVDLAVLDAGPRQIAASTEHQVAELGCFAQRTKLFGAFDGTDLLQHVIEADDLRLGHQLDHALVDVVWHPAVGIERAGVAVHADATAVELQFLEPVGDGIRPGLGARPHVADPVLCGAPAFQERRHLHDRGRLAAHWEDQDIELGVTADRAEVAGVGGVEVPHRRPAPQHDGVEIACGHLLAHGGPAPVALLQ